MGQTKMNQPSFTFGKMGAISLIVIIMGGIVYFTLGNFPLYSAPAQLPPYPYSTHITFAWVPKSEIIRDAVESDTWPITWGDDDALYTAYGDGYGFDGSTKLSLGFAKVTGSADSFTGVNIASGDEQTGQGPTGKKASGMLMVDGTLYMWVRNANKAGEHCQLASSDDHAKNWAWSSWTFTEFGYCTFINYGKNYAGGGEYVYTITHDNPSAYTPANHFILMRVPKNEITNRNAYEFFKGLDAGNPIWTSDVNQRGAVFTHSGRALRSGISYNATIGRYLWWQQIPVPDVDTRNKGGFGIYDAPNPWGPWTTVFYNEDWDVGPGETASFPTKWMSDDGKILHLVFSGNDQFSVRRAVLLIDADKTFLPTVQNSN